MTFRCFLAQIQSIPLLNSRDSANNEKYLLNGRLAYHAHVVLSHCISKDKC